MIIENLTLDATKMTSNVQYYDGTSTKRDLGQLIIQETDQVSVAQLVTKNKTAELGATKRATDTNFINPVGVLDALMGQGFQIQKFIMGRHGAILRYVVSHPDYNFDDLFDYDYNDWDGYGGGLQPALMVTMKMYTQGAPIAFSGGLYRMICENGIINQYMEFGNYKLNSRSIKGDIPVLVSNVIERAMEEALGLDNGVPKGKLLGSGEIVGKVVEAAVAGNNSFDPKYAYGLHEDITERFLKQMKHFEGESQVHTVDVLQGLTNAVNLHYRDHDGKKHGDWRTSEAIQGATTAIVEESLQLQATIDRYSSVGLGFSTN